MGPWSIRDSNRPFMPGCSHETIRQLVARGVIRPETVIRGPTTRQFWELAARTPGVAHLLGKCYACQKPLQPSDYACKGCGAVCEAPTDRQHLGLSPVRLLPGTAPASRVAASAEPGHGGAANRHHEQG